MNRWTTSLKKHKGLLDSFIGRYEIKMRSRKWYMRLFYHLLELAFINSWFLMKRTKDLKKIGPKYMYYCVNYYDKKGRPSGLESELKNKIKRPNDSSMPTSDVRLDNMSNFPVWGKTRVRCKYPKCKAKTFVHCEKCVVVLCFNK